MSHSTSHSISHSASTINLAPVDKATDSKTVALKIMYRGKGYWVKDLEPNKLFKKVKKTFIYKFKLQDSVNTIFKLGNCHLTGKEKVGKLKGKGDIVIQTET